MKKWMGLLLALCLLLSGCGSTGGVYVQSVEVLSNMERIQRRNELDRQMLEQKKKDGKLTKIFGTAVIVTIVAALITGILSGFLFAKEIMEEPDFGLLDEDNRIAVGGVFYDKKGNSYDEWDKVILYDKENRTYTYTVEEPENAEDDLFAIPDYYYIRDDGEKYFTYDCYVSEDGWFYCDKGGLLELVSEDTSAMSQEELNEYYNSLLESEDSGYKYYDYAYKDKNGKIYYSADEASWNEKGELITAENDVVK